MTPCRHDVSFRPFPPRQAEQKGLYRSAVHLNFIDASDSWGITSSFFFRLRCVAETAMLRRLFQIQDMNMFVSNFVLMALFESEELGTVTLYVTTLFC